MLTSIKLKLVQVNLVLVLWAEIYYFFSVKKHFELFPPLLRVVVLKSLIRHRVTIGLYLACLHILLENKFKLLEKARTGKFRRLKG